MKSLLLSQGWLLLVIIAGLSWFGCVVPGVEGFVFHESESQSSYFGEGEVIPMLVGSLTSRSTQAPMDYYDTLPEMCAPNKNTNMYEHQENMGQLFAGERIHESPYLLQMRKDFFCHQLCVADLEQLDDGGTSDYTRLEHAIRSGYSANWILDNLNAIWRRNRIDSFAGGIPLGFVDRAGTAFVYNHLNIYVMYDSNSKLDDNSPPTYRIVRFAIQPMSIAHEISTDSITTEEAGGETTKILNPINSCDPNIHRYDRRHTHLKMLFNDKYKGDNYDSYDTDEIIGGQIASGRVLYTYDVIWRRTEDVEWSNRWEIYLTMDNMVPFQVHWYSVINSLVLLAGLCCIVLAIWIYRLRRAAKLTPVGTTDMDDGNHNQQSESTTPNIQKWRLLHADVFRPPSFSPLMLAVYCGTGAHLLATALAANIMPLLGITSSWHRGSMLLSVWILYPIMAYLGGYTTIRFLYILGLTSQEQEQQATLLTAMGFSGVLLISYITIQIAAASISSTLAIPLLHSLIFLVMEAVVLIPMTFWGARTAKSLQNGRSVTFPTETSDQPRPIPQRSRSNCFVYNIGSFLLNGLFPFLALYVELFFLYSTAFYGTFYNTHGVLLLVSLLVLAISDQLNMLSTYWQLCRENHQWWWFSWRNGAATGAYILLYSILYYRASFDSYYGGWFLPLFYFITTTIFSLAVSLMLGFVGVANSLWFNTNIFSLIAASE